MANIDARKVLIVDDNPFNRQFLSALLEEEGCDVEEAQSGKEALEKIQADPFHLIFMDILMPGMDGFETTRKIRDMGYMTPVIAISAMSLKQDREHALSCGCNDFVPKPVDFERITAILEKYPAQANDADLPSKPPDSSTEDFKFDPSSYNILLVEEEDDVRATYESLLFSHGFSVTSVGGGDAAWGLINAVGSEIGIIVSNIFTSGIDALGLLTRVKREYPNILFFIYTEEDNPETFQLAVQQGVNGILTRKKVADALIKMIASAIFQYEKTDKHLRDESTTRQVRRAQAQLIQSGCKMACKFFDIAYATLHEAGGDIARCHRFNLDGRCGFVFGDVAGHDVMSSYMSAIFFGVLMSAWENHPDPMDLLYTTNQELYKIGYDNSHVCATAMLMDRRRHKLKIATAGNPGGILIKLHQDAPPLVEVLTGGGLCLGMLKEEHLFNYEEIDLDENSLLLMHTDGISQEFIIDVLGKEIPLAGRVSVKGIGEQLIKTLLKDTPQTDDILILSLSGSTKDLRQDLHYAFLSSYEGVDEACIWLDRELTQSRVPKEKDRDFILLAVREMLLNAVEHGNQKNPEAYVDMTLQFSKKGMRINVSDEGKGFDLIEVEKEIRQMNGMQLGKRGLPLIQSVAERIEVRGGTVSLFV